MLRSHTAVTYFGQFTEVVGVQEKLFETSGIPQYFFGYRTQRTVSLVHTLHLPVAALEYRYATEHDTGQSTGDISWIATTIGLANGGNNVRMTVDFNGNSSGANEAGRIQRESYPGTNDRRGGKYQRWDDVYKTTKITIITTTRKQKRMTTKKSSRLRRMIFYIFYLLNNGHGNRSGIPVAWATTPKIVIVGFRWRWRRRRRRQRRTLFAGRYARMIGPDVTLCVVLRYVRALWRRPIGFRLG